MGVEQNFFIGPYLRVWVPQEKVEDKVKTCINKDCSNYRTKGLLANFCPECGRETMSVVFPRVVSLNLWVLLEETFSDGDMFEYLDLNPDPYILVIPNNLETQGGINPREEKGIEFSYPKDYSDFEREDWKKLTELLEIKKIKYEKCIGVLYYLS